MILSMTGYGDAEDTIDGISYVLEIRSVNNRYFKSVIRLPDWLLALEPDIDRVLRARLSRGSINLQLKMRATDDTAASSLNTTVLKEYLSKLEQISQGVDRVQINIGSLLSLPGVYAQPEPDEAERQRMWGVVQKLLDTAIGKLLGMRREEGQALAKDLIQHCGQVAQHTETIMQLAPAVVKEYQSKLTTRVNQLLQEGQLQVSQDDLLREVAVYADRCDISEEVVRLNCHIDQFQQLVNGNEHAGRKLDFVAQEMLREANTIGSKANDAVIAKHVVEIKGLIDRLKEQVQNVE